MTATSLDLTPLAEIGTAIARLCDQGWTVADGIGSVEVALSNTPDPAAGLASLAPLASAALNIEAVGRRAGSKLVIRVVNGTPEIVEHLSGDLREIFDDRSQDDAIAALGGDADAALRLPMEWSVDSSFSFARLLAVPDGASVSVSLYATTVNDYVLATTAARVTDLTANATPRVLVALDAAGTARLGSLVLAGAASDATSVAVAVAVAVDLGVQSFLGGEALAGPLPPPGALLLRAGESVPSTWELAVAHVTVLAAQLVWRALASEEQVQDGAVALTFHGYKKSVFFLPEEKSWKPQHVAETLALREWALHDASPDRLLAVRQVSSLYDSDAPPFSAAADVRASAEVIYMGLRSDAVAEAVKSSREAHAQAQDAARQTVKNATDMIKGAIERSLAGLVAVGAVLVANAGRALPDDVGRLLLVLVAVFLLVLAVASVTLEGPLLALPARKLKEDLVHQAGVLTERQRNGINLLPSLVAARRRITAVRYAVPALYLTFAILLLAFGFPGEFN